MVRTLLGMALLLSLSVAARGAEITGVDAGGQLVDQSANVLTNSAAGYQELLPGTYAVKPGVDISGAADGWKNLAVGSGVDLTAAGAEKIVGLTVNDFRVTGGAVSATGGNGDNFANGLHVFNNLVQDGGEITAKGGGRENAGIFAGRVTIATAEKPYNEYLGGYTQSSGVLRAYGGEEGWSTGLSAVTIDQKAGGVIHAQAGTGSWSHGITSTGDATFAGRLNLHRGAAGAKENRVADFGSNESHTLTFASTSSLVFDMEGGGGLPFIRAEQVAVENGATVEFTGTAYVPKGTSSHIFIDALYDITGEFSLNNPQNLEISIGKQRQDSAYVVYFNRTGTPGGTIGSGSGVSGNVGNFVKSLDAAFGNTDSRNAALMRDLGTLDTLSGPEAREFATRLFQKMTPIDATVAAGMAANINTTTNQSIAANLFAPASGSRPAAFVASSSSLASIRSPSGVVRSFWASPLAQWTRTRPLSGDFVKVVENTYGTSLGFGVRQEYNFAAAVGVHYLHSDMNSRTARIDSNLYGFNLYGRKYFANRRCVNPFVEGGAGYTFTDMNQVRTLGNEHSSPNTHILNANLALGVDYAIGNTVLTPKIGVDYNHVNTAAYTEKGGTTPLSVRADNLNSFKGVFGLGAKTDVSDCLYLTASASYRHEFADRNSVIRSSVAALPEVRFVTKGERRSRSSGLLGVGMGWQAGRNVLVGLNYDLGIAEKQNSHAVSAKFALDF